MSEGRAAIRGVFVTIEGLDFCGKSTLVQHLKPLFEGHDPPFFFTREPGGTPVAERIRAILLDNELEIEPWTEAYLYAAARADHMRRRVLPHLESGHGVISERYLDSSLAYQGFGRGLGDGEVKELNRWATVDVTPDLTFYLQLSSEERSRRARAQLDRLERSGEEFAERVRSGFEALVQREPARFRVLDALRAPQELARTVYEEIVRVSNRKYAG